MSQWDIKPVIDAIKRGFGAMVHTEICLATQVRQEAVAEQASAPICWWWSVTPLRNSRRLAEVGRDVAGVSVVQVSSVSEFAERLPVDGEVVVTSGRARRPP